MHKKGNNLSDSQIDTENAKNNSKSLYLSQEIVLEILSYNILRSISSYDILQCDAAHCEALS